MWIIAVFIPGIISLRVVHRRSRSEWKFPDTLFDYLVWTLVDTWLSTCVIVYAFGLNETVYTYLNSFSFFTKYVFVSAVIAFIIPYIKELVCRNIEISFGQRDGGNSSAKKNN
jgi:hypothetical protein